MSAPSRVLVTGTFDVENFGDLLFPLVAAHALAPHGLEVVPVSPTATPVPHLADAPRPVSAEAMLAGGEPLRGILIGGGYIVHHQDATALPEYGAAGLGPTAYASLWVGASAAAALRDVPVAWNAPGVPVPFGGARRRALVAAVLRAASYVSVRDPGSVEFLAPPPDVEARVVPDTVLGLAGAWPRAALGPDWRALARRKGLDPERRTLVVHLRTRTLGATGLPDLAAALDALAARTGLVPLLLSLGRSLGDPEAARALSAALRSEHVLADDPASLREIVGAIAHAGAYAGASMHGYVVASAYDVPGVMVARPAHRKFGGLAGQLGRPGDLTRDWGAGLAALEAQLGAPAAGPRIPPAVHAALDHHWAAIRRALDRPEERAAARADLLRHLLRDGVGAAGLGWALGPLLRRAG